MKKTVALLLIIGVSISFTTPEKKKIQEEEKKENLNSLMIQYQLAR